jgi:hypothetical protein
LKKKEKEKSKSYMIYVREMRIQMWILPT